MSYDVNRWLCDAETRSVVKGVTDDALKIHEAKLSVSAEYGDACRVLNTGRMNTIRDYQVFKDKCLKFWRPASERDRFLALSQFLSVEYDSSLGIFASNLEAARSGIIQDLEEDSSFEQGNAAHWASSNRRSETLVALEDVLSYISWGVIFKAAPPALREALRKVSLTFSDDYIDILSEAQGEMLKIENKVKVEMSAFATKKQRKFENRQNNRKSNFRKKTTSRCFNCNKIGHFSKECRQLLQCSSCNKRGHLASNCYAAKKQDKASAQSSSNVAVTDNSTGNSSSSSSKGAHSN